MTELKNIVIVNDFDYVQGGASKVAIETANILVEKGYNVYYFCGCTNEKNELDKRVEVICTNSGEYLKSKNKLLGAIKGLYDIKNKRVFAKFLKKCDRENTVIHVHGWTKSLSCSIFSAAFSKKYKLVLTLHDYFVACPNGGFFNYQNLEICDLKPLSMKCIRCNCDSRSYAFKLYRVLRYFIQNKIVRLNKKIENVIYISDIQYDILKSFLKNKRINAKKIQNPIHISKNGSVNFRQNDYYLYVGRVSKEKGTRFFCEACSKAKKKGIVVGTGDCIDELKNEYPDIEFVGWKNRTEVLKYMLKAKALIFPSLWYEGAPLTIDEASKIGLPCIVSNSSSATEKIIHGKNGFIYESKNVKQLTEYMKKIDKMDYKYINNSIDEDMYIDEIVRYYRKVMSR